MVSIPHRFASASMDALVQLLSSPEMRLALFHEGAAALAKILAVHAGKADLFDRVHVALVGILQYLRNGDLGRLNGEWRIACYGPGDLHGRILQLDLGHLAIDTTDPHSLGRIDPHARIPYEPRTSRPRSRDHDGQ